MTQWYIGLMSGTSMDGVDCALVDVDAHRFINGFTYPYPKDLRTALESFSDIDHMTLAQWYALHHAVGRVFAEAALALLERCKRKASDIRAIGSHGQTISHMPHASSPFTCQLGCGHVIAEATQCTVVADFRMRDMVLGGQGAPFAPWYHDILLRGHAPIMLVNIGGIANLSFIFPSQPASGFDVGPGNCLLDAWCLLHRQAPYDKDGTWAMQGGVIPELLERLLAYEKILVKSPHSLCKRDFSLSWLQGLLKGSEKPEDVQATLMEYTVLCIVRGIQHVSDRDIPLLVCGGGVHNAAMLARLRTLMPTRPIDSTATYGIDPDHLEAQIFATLAKHTMMTQPVDLTVITGARKPAVMGVIYPYA